MSGSAATTDAPVDPIENLTKMMAGLATSMQSLQVSQNQMQQEFSTKLDSFSSSIDARFGGLEGSLSELEMRLATTESQMDSIATLSQRIDAIQASIASSASSSTTPSSFPAASATPLTPRVPPRARRPRSPARHDPADVAIADSNSEDLNPPKAQRTQVPHQVPPHSVPASQSQSFSPPDPSRNIVSESSIHFTTSIPKFTYDLKTFLALLFEQAFDTPVSVENLPIRHVTPECHSDINFGDKVRAEHFLAWVQANPKVKDEYGNEVDIRAAHTATPTERAMG